MLFSCCYFMEKYGSKNICQEFRLKNMYETKNHFIEGINQNDRISKNNKKV